MNELLRDKKVSCALFVFLMAVSILTTVKIIGEIGKIGDNEYQNSIMVEGKGEVTAVADLAVVRANLSKEAPTAKEAQDLLNESITKTLNYLKEQAIEDKDVKSEYSGLQPKYSYAKTYCYTYPCPSNDPKIIAYTATQSIEIKVREVDKANVVKTGLAELGITDISGPTFSIDNEDALNDEAKSKAIADARAKAEVLAKDLGVKLGKITSFSENGGYYPYRDAMMDESAQLTKAMSSVVPPELPKGENKITKTVTIYYEIK